jgi:hypothetical protein
VHRLRWPMLGARMTAREAPLDADLSFHYQRVAERNGLRDSG